MSLTRNGAIKEGVSSLSKHEGGMRYKMRDREIVGAIIYVNLLDRLVKLNNRR